MRGREGVCCGCAEYNTDGDQGGQTERRKGCEKANKDRNEGVRQSACVDAAQSVTHLDVLACLVAS